MHELEIAKVSHDIAKDLEMLTKADEDNDVMSSSMISSKEHLSEQSPETEVLVFAVYLNPCSNQNVTDSTAH